MVIIDSFSVDNNTYGMDHAQSADNSFEQDDEYISQFVLNQKVTEDTDKTRKEEERKKSEPEDDKKGGHDK